MPRRSRRHGIRRRKFTRSAGAGHKERLRRADALFGPWFCNATPTHAVELNRRDHRIEERNMNENPLRRLSEFEQSVWFDNIQREMLQNGALAAMIRDDGLRGITSNPSIFQKAIVGSKVYEAAIVELLASCKRCSARDIFYQLAIEDIQAAADAFAGQYEQSGGRDGMVSIEVSPELAYDTQGTIKEARYLHQRVGRPNVMIKVPATKEGLGAIETLTADGINVNATLLFSVDRYREVAEAFLRGLDARMQQNLPLRAVASVASFFVSRVDSSIDKLLEQGRASAPASQQPQIKELLGQAAVANAKRAYAVYKQMFSGPRFERLQAAGAQTQRLLWASTGTKNPNYSDVLYVETLIGRDTVNTMPPATYQAFRDHGKVAATLDHGGAEAEKTLRSLKEYGIDIKQVTDQLEREGVKLFADAFAELLSAIDAKLVALSPRTSAVV
jgi:transaldolase